MPDEIVQSTGRVIKIAMRACVLGVVAAMTVSCSAFFASSPATPSVESLPTDGQPTLNSPFAIATGETEASPLPPAVVEILSEPGHRLAVSPLPAGHEYAIDRDEAVDIALSTLNVTGPVVYTDHGIAYITDDLDEPVWIVIAKVQDMEPIPVGPQCPPHDSSCTQTWAINDYAVALVSDQTGDTRRSFATMVEVPPPSS
jgi:hypothetical protein